MNFSMPNNPTNLALAATVNRRIHADTMRQTAYASFWRLLGVGGLLLLAGMGVGAAFFGYAYATDQRAAMGKLSTALAEALNKVTLKTDGTIALNTEGATVKLDPNDATVKLDPNDATVKHNTDGATVRLDPNGVTLDRPSAQQLRPDQQPPSNAHPVTNYTVFKSVEFAKGEVVTGWSFHSNTDAQPYRQYCYYIQGGYDDNNLMMRYNIAVNGVRVPTGRGFPVDLDSAFANCVWLGGSENRSRPPTRT